MQFYTYKKLQGSQTNKAVCQTTKSFTLIRNYKVLKPPYVSTGTCSRFTLIRNYKVLKLLRLCRLEHYGFYTYKKLQGSQTAHVPQRNPEKFYTYKKLQGSQTKSKALEFSNQFYTYKKLQGSQT